MNNVQCIITYFIIRFQIESNLLHCYIRPTILSRNKEFNKIPFEIMSEIVNIVYDEIKESIHSTHLYTKIKMRWFSASLSLKS